MRNTYKYIYCDASSFGINDLKNFPTLNFRNKDLKNTFHLNYENLFYLSSDNKYYIFNIMITNDYEDNNSNEKWILGLPFWRKYQFSFDIDNKLIYYYNKDGYFIDKTTHNTKNTYMREINDEVENINNDTNITNNGRIIDSNNNKKIKNRNNDEEIKIRVYIFIIVLIIIFVFLFCFLVFLVKKTLFKKGYILMRNKKASELEEDDSLSSKNINFIKKDNDLIKKEIEMQNK
jgi:ATP-dependent Zn protease